MSRSVTELVAQTFDQGHQNARIGAEKDGSKVAGNEPRSLTKSTPELTRSQDG